MVVVAMPPAPPEAPPAAEEKDFVLRSDDAWVVLDRKRSSLTGLMRSVSSCVRGMRAAPGTGARCWPWRRKRLGLQR